jgi:hypothetical protein
MATERVETKAEWKARMGIGSRQNRHHVHAGTHKVEQVVSDDGPARGHVVGVQDNHWSGRVDASVTGAQTTEVNPYLATRRMPDGSP